LNPSALELPGGRVEYRLTEGASPAVVFLHEGLGSMDLWRDFPARAAAGHRTLVWSRHGYGRSDVVPPPRPLSYMHAEALSVLPEVLARLGLDDVVLVGHSDGASIALIHASGRDGVRGVVAVAPHVFVEDRTIEGIEAARRAYVEGDLRRRLARHHSDVDATFWGWNRAWLDPSFRDWNIEEYLAGVTCPVLVVQAEDDPYGSVEQVQRIESGAGGPVHALVLPSGGHAPHVSKAEKVAAAVAGFLESLS
jgi:pimeloyl-ACP methyl ester carboxylesterase